MGPLSGSNELSQALRAQVERLRRRARNAPGGPRADTAQAAPPAADTITDALQRVRAIPRDDPDAERKALKAYLECVLLAELGSDAAADPAFSGMVEHVQQQLLAEPALQAAALQAARALLHAGGR